MDWSVQRGSGSSLLFGNETGETVTNVEMKLHGHAVGGMLARRNWSIQLDKMDPGEAVKSPFRAARGENADPPRIEITWTSAAGHSRRVVLDDLPL